jgi:hypothetical protein
MKVGCLLNDCFGFAEIAELWRNFPAKQPACPEIFLKFYFAVSVW